MQYALAPYTVRAIMLWLDESVRPHCAHGHELYHAGNGEEVVIPAGECARDEEVRAVVVRVHVPIYGDQQCRRSDPPGSAYAP
eukprot:7167989-Pyramimonas_sp.AAC.1